MISLRTDSPTLYVTLDNAPRTAQRTSYADGRQRVVLYAHGTARVVYWTDSLADARRVMRRWRLDGQWRIG